MSDRPLLVFDFDGVIVDGMDEYWWSARTACARLMGPTASAAALAGMPAGFRALRPWIHHGWEMVLMAALLQERDGLLQRLGVAAFVDDYADHCRQALQAKGWTAPLLQQTLEQVRHAAVGSERGDWLARHRPFPGVPERLRSLDAEGVDWAVLTTKGRRFTAELLDALALRPTLLFGHEDGTKPDVLLQLKAQRPLRGLVEDRRPTLETVLATPGLEGLPCFLADWGYLRPIDREGVPEGIALLSLEQLASPLADWP
ncbi:MAG: HAD family hydrolase [Synechococcus sp.]